MKKLILTTLLVLLLASPAKAVTYYADPTGSGTDCTIGSPCAITSVWAKLSTSDDICLNDGTYTLTSKLVWSGVDGTALDYITVTNCEGGNVRIEGGEHVTSWTDQGGNIWRSNTLTNTPDVPPDGYIGFVWNVADPVWLTNETNSADVTSGEYYINSGSKYVEIYVDDDTDPDTWTPPADFIVPIFVDRVLQIQDVDYLKLYGTDTNSYNDKKLFIGGSAFRGLEIGNGVTSGVPVDNITVQDIEVGFCSEGCIFLNALTTTTYTNVLIDDVYIHHNTDEDATQGSGNGHCFKFGSAVNSNNIDATLQNSTIHDCIRSGVWCSGGVEYCTIQNNHIYSFNMRNSERAPGAGCNDDDLIECVISHNRIEKGDNTTGAVGIYLQAESTGGPAAADIIGNRVSDMPVHCMNIFGNGGGLIPAGNIRGNRFTGCVDDGISVNDTTAVTISNNVFFDNEIDMGVADADGVTMNNNKISMTNEAAFQCVSGATVTAEDGNNFYNAGGANFSDACSAGIPNTNDTQVYIRPRRVM